MSWVWAGVGVGAPGSKINRDNGGNGLPFEVPRFFQLSVASPSYKLMLQFVLCGRE